MSEGVAKDRDQSGFGDAHEGRIGEGWTASVVHYSSTKFVGLRAVASRVRLLLWVGCFCGVTCVLGCGKSSEQAVTSSVEGDTCGGTSVDLQTNNAHCGACDHPCSNGAACTNGTCPATVLVTNDPSRSIALAHDSDALYWRSGPDIRRVKKDGTGNTLVTTVGNSISEFSLAVDDTHVYYIDGGRPGRAPKTGGVASQITGAGTASRIAVDQSNLYYAGASDGELAFVPKSGGVKTVLATGLSNPWGLAVDAARVYLCDRGEFAGGTGKASGARNGFVGYFNKFNVSPRTIVAENLSDCFAVAFGGPQEGLVWYQAGAGNDSIGIFAASIGGTASRISGQSLYSLATDGATVFVSRRNEVLMKRQSDKDFFPIYRADSTSTTYGLASDPQFVFVSVSVGSGSTQLVKIPR